MVEHIEHLVLAKLNKLLRDARISMPECRCQNPKTIVSSNYCQRASLATERQLKSIKEVLTWHKHVRGRSSTEPHVQMAKARFHSTCHVLDVLWTEYMQ